MSQPKKTIKICCDGETKRLKISGDYAELISRTKESFGKQVMNDSEFKFFYLDDEQEVISITSQADLTEALNIEDLSSLKLTVASNMQDALRILYESMMDSKSLAGSISQSQIGRARANSEFDQLSSDKRLIAGQSRFADPMSDQKDRLNQMPAMFQRQMQADCDSSHKSSHQDVHEKANEDPMGNAGVMVVGMGKLARKDQPA